ncbi:MAG: cellulase family glycosylhydrolase [Cytophagales bacterium]|nr:cellulase family glycosylhydrolase [Cytophagales bacterium]
MLRILTFIALCLLLQSAGTHAQVSGQTPPFTTAGSKIYDPQGREFIAKGINVNGFNWVWPGSTLGYADKIIDCWGFNLVRVNNALLATMPRPTDSNNLNEIIGAYTSRNVVVMLEAHDKTGNYYEGADLDSLKRFYRYYATLHKNDPYVWFNVSNEPGGSSSVANVGKWLTMHREVISVIRDEVGAANMIVVDGQFWGQEAGAWNKEPVLETNSAILSYGSDLIHFNNKTYPNVAFSVHLYDQWVYGDARMADYFDRILAKGFPLLVGEYGVSNGTARTEEATESLFRTAPSRGIGRIAWHWWGGDQNDLTTAGNGGADYVDNCDDPTNLSWLGQLVWNDLRGRYEAPDTQAPAAATLHSTVTPENYVALAWEAAADNVGASKYLVYRDGLLLATTRSRTFTVTGLAPLTTYVFSVVAVDLAGNESAPASVSVTTRRALTTVYQAEQATAGGGALVATANAGYTGTGYVDMPNLIGPFIEWTVQAEKTGYYDLSFRYANPGSGVANRPLTIRQDGAVVYAAFPYPSTGAGTNWAETTTPLRVFLAKGAHQIKAAAEANRGPNIDYLRATYVPDTTPPAAPANVQVSATMYTVTLGWDATTDNIAVASYNVYQGDDLVTNTPGLTVTLTGLTPATPYAFAVSARDEDGNESARTAVPVHTAPDTEPPAAPAAVTASATSTSVALSWTAAADNVGVVAYKVYKDAVYQYTITGTETTLTSLESATPYYLSVSATDLAGNESEQAGIEVTTKPNGFEDQLPGGEVVKLFPNPFVNAFTVQLSGREIAGHVKVLVFNLRGKVVAQGELHAASGYTTTLRMDWQQPGIYIVKIMGKQLKYERRVEKM